MLRLAGDKAGPEFGEHAEVEPGISQLEPQGVLPVDPGPDSVSGLPVAEVLEELEDRDQSQPPRCKGGLPPARVEPSEVLILVEDAKFIPQPSHNVALRESCPGDPHGLDRDLTDRLGMKAHGFLLLLNSQQGIRRQYLSYVWTNEGWLYLAVVLDLFARRVVGWAVSDRLHKELALEALRKALAIRRPGEGLTHHADRGSQYCSIEYQAELRKHGIRISMSGKGNCYDNSVVETFFKTLKSELVWRTVFQTRAEAKAAIGRYIDGFYNPVRRHSTLDYVSPVQFERLVG
jgi:transposase InsO family protein